MTGFRTLTKHLQGQHDQKRHAGRRSASWDITGSDLGPVYHGGKKKVRKVDPDLLQTRDSGYYGPGFYTTGNREFAKSYGRSITEVTMDPNATVLKVDALDPQKADPGLMDAVIDNYIERGQKLAKRYNRLEKFNSHIPAIKERIATSPIEWKDAVRVYAETYNYDIVKYSAGEIVIRNLDKIVSYKQYE